MSSAGLLLLGLVSAATNPAGKRSQTLILTDGLAWAYELEHRLIVAGTDSVFVGAELLDRGEYELDYERGTVLLPRLPRWTPVRVSYRCLGFSGIAASYRLHEPVRARPGSPDTVRVGIGRDSLLWTPHGEVKVEGSKSVGFSVGGIEGTGINQATDLSLAGTLEGVEIEAELSDQSSPIPPEGTTRDIEELDRIAVSVRGSGWSGSFGDVELALPASGFGTVERKAVGGVADVQVGTTGFVLGYAQPKGEFVRVVIAGEDGVQGPYVLGSSGRLSQVVAASERVYLDGERMVRGWDADYTIDYSTGELLFTNRRVITGLSRIEVAYQQVTEAYARSDQLLGTSVRTGPLEFRCGVFREGDDPSVNRVLELSEADREYLGSIGSDTSRAWLPGGSYVGPGKGSYVLEQGYYRYVGDEQGDYRVLFTLVGDSLGEYVYDDSVVAYRYVGPGAGEYSARVRVDLPRRLEVASIETGVGTGGLTARATGVLRRTAENLFAEGGAAASDLGLSLSTGWKDERYHVSYLGRFLTRGFEFLAGDVGPAAAAGTAVDFEYRWGGTSRREMRQSNEVVLGGKPAEFAELSAEAGRLERFDRGLVQRYQGRGRLGPATLELGRAGEEDRLRLGLEPRIGPFGPKAEWYSARAPDSRSRVLGGGLGFRPTETFGSDLSCRVDEVQRPDSGSARFSRAEQGALLQASASWIQADRLRVTGLAGRQERRYLLDAGEDWEQWFGNLAGSAAPLNGLRIQTDLGQTNRRVQLKDEVFRYVGTGNGDYSRDSLSGRYYSDPDGDYVRDLVAKGRTSSAPEQTVFASAQYSGWRPLAVDVSLSRRTARADTALLQSYDNQNVRLGVHALEPVLTGYVGTTWSSSLDRTLALTGRGSSRSEHYAEVLTSRIPELELRLRLELADEKRRYTSELLDYSESGWRFELAPVVGDRLRLELLLGVDRKAIEEPVLHPELGRFVLVEKEGSAGRTWSLTDRTRIRALAGVVQRSGSTATLPSDVARTRPLGWTPSGSVELNHLFSDILNASAQYRFTDRPDRPAEHQVSGEMRASF